MNYDLINRKSTDYLIYISQNVSFAKLHVHSWSREDFITKTRRGVLKDCQNKLEWIEKQLRQFVPIESRPTLDAEVIDEDLVIQSCTLTANFLSLTKSERDDVENYLNEILNKP